MITELLGLAGSGALGSVVGMISDSFQRKHELELAREQRRDDKVAAHLTGFSASPYFGYSFVLIAAVYGTCCILCIMWPNIELVTFNPDSEPTRVSFLWGMLSWERTATHVWTITTGGVAYGLLHPLAFIIGAVLTGLSPMRRN